MDMEIYQGLSLELDQFDHSICVVLPYDGRQGTGLSTVTRHNRRSQLNSDVLKVILDSTTVQYITVTIQCSNGFCRVTESRNLHTQLKPLNAATQLLP